MLTLSGEVTSAATSRHAVVTLEQDLRQTARRRQRLGPFTQTARCDTCNRLRLEHGMKYKGLRGSSLHGPNQFEL